MSISQATNYTDDFSGDLSNWTAGPSHLDSYSIVGEELYMNGSGHLTGSGGWGVLQFNQALGSNFTITWDSKITYYDYANFVLFADPWTFNSYGITSNGYNAFIDINDPVNTLFDMLREVNGAFKINLYRQIFQKTNGLVGDLKKQIRV